MCGIVGVIDTAGSADAAALARAADALRHRGPDDEGVWTEGNAGLAHRRLAVLDVTSAGHQPMVSADGRYVIVLNGEIYNFRELRRELDPDESRWRSESDTEVVLAAYAAWGTECVSRLRGMFAFAIWDRAARSLFAARDRMGVKPLYYHHSARRFAFASRPGPLAALLPGTPSLDAQALRYYLEGGYIPAPLSLYREMRKLEPAHWLILKDGALTVRRYWDFRAIPPEQAWEQRPEADLLDELDEIVSRSVRYRMVSDVPLGVFLSGGIDSSLVAAMVRKFSSQPVQTFTMGFDEKSYDESAHAAAVARHLGTDHQSETMRVDDLLGLMPQFRANYDEPFFDSSAFPTMAVSRLARRFVTVSLSGDGGDELFGGYHYYEIVRRLGPVYAGPGPLRRMAAAAARALPSHRMKLLSGALSQPDAIAAFAFSRSIAKDFEALLLPEARAGTQSLSELFVQSARAFPPGLSAAEAAMRLDASHTLPDDYLQKLDVASMAYSLEARDPLLDQDLVEWAMRLPLKWKLAGGTNKYLLRKLAYRYVPRELLDRPKQGFGVPIDAWLRGPLRQRAEELLEDRGLFGALPLDQAKVRDLFRLHLSGGRNAHPLLWAVLMLLEHVARPATPAAVCA